MLVALAVGQLDQAQPVAAREQAHRLGVDRDRSVGKRHSGRQIVFVEMDAHSIVLNRLLGRLRAHQATTLVAAPGFQPRARLSH